MSKAMRILHLRRVELRRHIQQMGGFVASQKGKSTFSACRERLARSEQDRKLTLNSSERLLHNPAGPSEKTPSPRGEGWGEGILAHPVSIAWGEARQRRKP